VTARVLPVECEARVSCSVDAPARAVHGHPRKRRQRDRDNDSVIGVCAPCHTAIHSGNADAYVRGVLMYSWEEITPYVPWWQS
jgi:cytochrome c553